MAAPVDSASGGTDEADGRGEPESSGRERADDAEADRRPATLADATADDGEAVFGALADAGVVEAAGDDVTLADEFAERWATETDRLSELSTAALADATVAAAPTAAAARAENGGDRAYVVLSGEADGLGGEVWLRRPVAVAETAAARALAETTDLGPGRRAVAAHGLAVFLDTCPVCGTDLVEAKAGGCCGPPRTDAEGHPLRALVCTDCRTQFAAFE